ncbi:MAG: hypothetical protein ABJB74_20210 [Gemmatimonas sp.]
MLSPLVALALILSLAACPASSGRDASARWVILFVNADYRIALDTAHVDRRRDGTYAVRYETWHLHGEIDQGLRFNREEVVSELRCVPLGFRTKEVALFLDQGPSLSRKPGDGVAPGSPWRAPGAKSVDLEVMRAACRLLSAQR